MACSFIMIMLYPDLKFKLGYSRVFHLSLKNGMLRSEQDQTTVYES